MRHCRNKTATVDAVSEQTDPSSTANLSQLSAVRLRVGGDPIRSLTQEVTMSTQLMSRPAESRIARIRQGLSPAEWTKLGGMGAVIVALNVVGWFIIIALVAPHHYSVGTKTFGVGIGLTAYTLGMRHAFDADHIAAIDNTTRKLMSEGKRPLSVGFWFSLGHSSIVFALAFLLSLGVKALVGPVKNDNSALHHYTGLIGTSVSGTFLFILATINVVILVGIVKVFRDMRRGVYDEESLEHHLNNRGLMNRILRPIMKTIKRPGQMYGVGLLFGLGFDTASEVALLVLAAAGAASALPWYAILALPILFAAGMCLFDTIDGTFMNFAYGWAFSKPVRKVYYNITITSLSVMVAFVIGGVELLGLLSQQLKITGRFWTDMQNADINTLGFVIVGLFVVTWAAALVIWRVGHIEEKWNAGMRTHVAAEPAD
jgi:high-affinity nickel-transport protein